jgi:ribose transport system substrate-binding protein
VSPIRKTACLTAAIASAALLAACSTTASTASGGGSTSRPTVALVTPISGLPFYNTMQCGAKAAAAKFNVDLSTASSPAFEVGQLQQVLDGAVAKNPQGIALVPTDPTAFNAKIQQLRAKGTKVITLDTGPITQKVDLATITSDNAAGGALAAQSMAKTIGGTGKVFVVSLAPSVASVQARATGFINEMKAHYPGVTVLQEQFAGSDTNKASQLTSAAIAANPDLVGVFATHEPAVLGAVAAISAARASGKIALVGYDADPTLMEKLNQGQVTALVSQDPYSEGFDGVRQLAQLIRGEIKPADLTYLQTTKLAVITKDNQNDDSVKQFIYKASC